MGVVILSARRKKKQKLCFSKKLLVLDYITLFFLLGGFVYFTTKGQDMASWGVVVCAWVAQLGISSSCYYWKAKAENLRKMPIQMLDDIPKDMRERADPNQIIASVLGMKD